MGTLRDAKNYGGIGAILLLVGVFIPLVGIAISIVGFILMVIAVKYISEAVGDRSIYNNMLYFVIIAIIGSVVAFLFVFIALLPFLAPGFDPITGPIDITDPAAIFAIVTFLIGLAVAWILSIVAAVFLRSSFNSISARLGVGLFGTSALLYLIGAILMIVIVGFFLIFVAEILMIVAFFSIPEQQPAPAMAQPPPAAP
ncbi:MAG: DUF996 domain-containing protein [Thermoplasmata archaeon]